MSSHTHTKHLVSAVYRSVVVVVVVEVCVSMQCLLFE